MHVLLVCHLDDWPKLTSIITHPRTCTVYSTADPRDCRKSIQRKSAQHESSSWTAPPFVCELTGHAQRRREYVKLTWANEQLTRRRWGTPPAIGIERLLGAWELLIKQIVVSWNGSDGNLDDFPCRGATGKSWRYGCESLKGIPLL